MAERRTRFEISWEILVFCRTPRSFTAIISRCDLNSKTGQEYLAFLSEKGFLSRTSDADKTRFQTTERGSGYITLFSRLYQEMFDSVPSFRL